jgi:hypothetical protein
VTETAGGQGARVVGVPALAAGRPTGPAHTPDISSGGPFRGGAGSLSCVCT